MKLICENWYENGQENWFQSWRIFGVTFGKPILRRKIHVTKKKYLFWNMGIESYFQTKRIFEKGEAYIQQMSTGWLRRSGQVTDNKFSYLNVFTLQKCHEITQIQVWCCRKFYILCRRVSFWASPAQHATQCRLKFNSIRLLFLNK